jgi:hypothetical protein
MVIPRRTILKAGAATTLALAAPMFWRRPALAATPQPGQIHLQFGDDAARDMTVSWTTAGSVGNPRVLFGSSASNLGSAVAANTVTYTDSVSGTEVLCHHAKLAGLQPGTHHAYAVTHDGATPVPGGFRTAPVGRTAFRFTSFGDQCTGTTGDALAAPQGSWLVDQIEAADPLFHTINGDLSYANTMGAGSNPAYDRAAVWDHWFTNNARSAANRPWMPALGNHESEAGNGPQGLAAYLSRFSLPSNASTAHQGCWYAFTVGSVRFITVDTNDVVYSTDFDFPILGYSSGAQRAWLTVELASARLDPAIDWIVVFVHYPVMSTAGGSDLGLRQQYMPLFDRYGVDLVLTGHSHDYERMYPVRGVEAGSATLQPHVVSTAADNYDTTQGSVHLVVGSGGVALPTPTYSGAPGSPSAGVTVQGGGTQSEPAPYSAKRDYQSFYGFLMVDVDPGSVAGGTTTMTLSFFHAAPSPSLQQAAYDVVHIQRPRGDARAPAAQVPDGAPLALAVAGAATAGAVAHRLLANRDEPAR